MRSGGGKVLMGCVAVNDGESCSRHCSCAFLNCPPKTKKKIPAEKVSIRPQHRCVHGNAVNLLRSSRPTRASGSPQRAEEAHTGATSTRFGSSVVVTVAGWRHCDTC